MYTMYTLTVHYLINIRFIIARINIYQLEEMGTTYTIQCWEATDVDIVYIHY